MRIVLITKQDINTTSHRLTEHFIEKLKKFNDIKFFSVKAYNHRKKRIVIPAKKLKKDYKPDIVICHAHSECLNKYFKEFKNQLKIMIAVDFWKIIKNNRLDWYYNNEFDLTVHRHFLPEIEKVNTETVWLPFSACDKEFYPQNKKLPFIGFAGNCMSPQYAERRLAIEYLDSEGLLVYNRGSKGLIRHERYSKFLRSFESILCSAEFDSPFGKLFEIMASGSIPLIPKFSGIDILFWKNTMMHYKKDCSNIIDQAKILLNDHDMRIEMQEKSYKNFKKAHTDDIRIKEFYDIIKAKYEGKEIPKKWGM